MIHHSFKVSQGFNNCVMAVSVHRRGNYQKDIQAAIDFWKHDPPKWRQIRFYAESKSVKLSDFALLFQEVRPRQLCFKNCQHGVSSITSLIDLIKQNVLNHLDLCVGVKCKNSEILQLLQVAASSTSLRVFHLRRCLLDTFVVETKIFKILQSNMCLNRLGLDIAGVSNESVRMLFPILRLHPRLSTLELHDRDDRPGEDPLVTDISQLLDENRNRRKKILVYIIWATTSSRSMSRLKVLNIDILHSLRYLI